MTRWPRLPCRPRGRYLPVCACDFPEFRARVGAPHRRDSVAVWWDRNESEREKEREKEKRENERVGYV